MISITDTTYTKNHADNLSIFVSSDAAWDHLTGKAGFGFIIYTNFYFILLAGATGDFYSSPLEAELLPILHAMNHCCLNC